MNGAGVSRNAIGYNSGPGMVVNIRLCTGGCRKRRSIGQFAGDSTVCKQCVRRSK